MDPKYSDFTLPNYVNTSIVSTIPAYDLDGKSISPIKFTLPDIMLAITISALNCLLISDTGMGKTQLIRDIGNAYFGGFGIEGSANFFKARANMTSILNIFETIDVDTTSGRYNSDQARQLNLNKISRLLHIVDELNLAPEVIQSDFYDLGEGEYSFKGQPTSFGKNGYAAFWATMNLNKNGDNGFSGTFNTSRALLNRTHFTLDLDTKRFRPTSEDLDLLARRGYSTAKTKNTEPQDLTEQILSLHQKVREQTRTPSLELRIFLQLIDKGLSYCAKDINENDKDGYFPLECNDCPTNDRLCSQLRNCSERTKQAITGLSSALAVVAEMKYGSPVKLGWFDLLLESLKLTSYHGNLNSNTLSATYKGRRQLMMDKAVSELSVLCFSIKDHIFDQTLEPRIVRYSGQIVPCNRTIENLLNKKGISYTTFSLKDTLEAKGLGTDWLSTFSSKGV